MKVRPGLQARYYLSPLLLDSIEIRTSFIVEIDNIIKTSS